MSDPTGPEPTPSLPPEPDGTLPFVDDLLSERSKAWLARQVEGGDASSRILKDESNPGLRPRLAGYTIGQRIGRGGMGTVYECHRDGSDARLAIKIISSGTHASDEERRRFMGEIGALLRLHHPHLSRLRDFGQDGSVAWFVMDFIDGRAFHQWKKEESPSWALVADLLGQACRAVAHAHRQGIIHRDLNPANIMVLRDGSPVIMDFGLARDLSSDEVLTVSGATVGTPPYMSPEQTLGTRGVLTVQSDVWGMGGVLYQALTGRPPFEGASTHEIFTAINETEVTRPRVHAPDIPQALERIALRCLQRDPVDRYPDMDALAADLETFAAGGRVRVRLPGFIGRIHRRARRHPLPWTLGAAIILLGLGFLGYAAVEQVRRWATWTMVVSANLQHDEMPAGLQVLNGRMQAVESTQGPDAQGLALASVPATAGLTGWWWLERPGLRGGSRMDLEFDLPNKDAIELVIDASRSQPVDWWHHPAGWAVKIQVAEQLTVSAAYLDRPDALPANPGYLLERPAGDTNRLAVTVEVADTTLTIHVAGCPPVVINEPLALGGSDHRGIGLRWFNPQSRLTRMRVDRLVKAELVSPLVGPDALLRHGQREAALAEYRLLATDHPSPAIGGQALLRAYATASLHAGGDAAVREALYQDVRRRGEPGLLDQADRIRALSLWSQGECARAVGVARDLVARRPDLNPILTFLVDRTWQVDRPCGDEILQLLVAAPRIGSLALADLGITDLGPIRGRKAWSVNITNNQVSDLEPLSSSGCSFLAASVNRIADLRPLAALQNLSTLYLAGNRISDLRPLGNLLNLRQLTLTGNEVSSLDGLPPNLTELIVGLAAEGIDSLRQMNPGLRTRGGNPLSSLHGLPVGQLTGLSLALTQVVDLDPLRKARQLNKLDLSGAPVRDLSALDGLPLADLSLNECTSADLTSIGHLPKLRRLYLRDSPATHLGSLEAALSDLTVFYAPGMALDTWPRVAAPALVEINLMGSQLKDVSGLALAPALRKLFLKGCGLSQIDPAVLTLNLDILDLRDNRLAGLGGLLESPQIPRNLLVLGNPLSDAACQSLIDAGRRLNRPNLAWQGASILAERRGDMGILKSVAMPFGRKLIAPFLSSTYLDAATAIQLASAAGARLAVPVNAEQNALMSEQSAGLDRPLWFGLSLIDGRVVDDQGGTPPFLAPIPGMSYRGYTSLPRNGGRLAHVQGGNWSICLDGKGNGMVLEWDQGW
jgi:Leucine-rich repeat (LRR) protein